jgi:raffinose/stachyose/melibiose transport system permease protein
MDIAKRPKLNLVVTFLIIFAILYLIPLFLVLMNSFKGRFYISNTPFAFPDVKTFVGLKNYIVGLARTGFFKAFGYSLFITVFSVGTIVFFTSMTAWVITRVTSKISTTIYYVLIFSMIVPFQMVMFTMSKIANMLHLDNPVGITVLYLGFGAGLSVFIFAGFVKTIPLEIEEAATMDGCNPIQTFFLIVFPILRPIYITVAILNTMWIWNDYLLPYLVIGTNYRTIPIAVQYLLGGYGSIDMGAMMAMLVLAIVPIVIFYLFAQKYIIEGVVAGAVKG